MQANSSGFYDDVPVFSRFSGVMDPGRYQPLPDDWTLGLADVVQSTKAIAENRYKAVNMAGASVIAAVANALGNREFPFVFGGDGASFAVAPNDAETARQALAATATWVQEELDLTLRIAMLPVSLIRQRGFDLKVARFGASRNVAYAMFSGGGVAFADAAMKRGEFTIPPAPPGTRPDLSGLSCRFSEMPSLRGVIMSIVVMPGVSMNSSAFRTLIEEIVQLVERSPDGSRPVPPGGPSLRWPPKGLELEARATRASGRLAAGAAAIPLWIHWICVPDPQAQDQDRAIPSRRLHPASGRQFRLSANSTTVCAWCSIAARHWRMRSSSGLPPRRRTVSRVTARIASLPR